MTTGIPSCRTKWGRAPGGSPQPAIDWLARTRAGVNNSIGKRHCLCGPRRDRPQSRQNDPGCRASNNNCTGGRYCAARTTGDFIDRLATRKPHTDTKTLSLLRSGVGTVALDNAAPLPPTNGGPSRISSAVLPHRVRPAGRCLDRPGVVIVVWQCRKFGERGGACTSAIPRRLRPDHDRFAGFRADHCTWARSALGPQQCCGWRHLGSAENLAMDAKRHTTQLLAATLKDSTRSLSPVTAGSRRASLSRVPPAGPKHPGQSRRSSRQSWIQPGQLTEKYSSALLRTTSGAWRIDRDGGTALLNSIDKELSNEMGPSGCCRRCEELLQRDG